jgi:Enoyl-(Acyl carrier protein) reductase
MTRQLAMEGSVHGIRVNSISPGLIESGATRAQLDEGDGRARQMLDRTLLGRLGQSGEVANVALFLPSDGLVINRPARPVSRRACASASSDAHARSATSAFASSLGARPLAQPLNIGPGLIRAGFHAAWQRLGEYERCGGL